MPGQLGLYIARRFSAALALVIGAAAFIIFLAEYLEVLRRIGDEPVFSLRLGATLAALRVPLVLDTIVSFAFLFAAMLSLLSMSGRLELVIARASGVSVWGFLAAPFAVAFIFGVLAATVFNPLAVAARDAARRTEAELSGPSTRQGEGMWFRQDGRAGPSIVYSGDVSNDGLTLFGVTAIASNPDGRFREKITGPRADFKQDRWMFEEAVVVSADAPPLAVKNYALPTALTAVELRRRVYQPAAVSLWSLPGYIDAAERTGGSADRYRVAFHSLLSRPLALIAMVTVAATVSLRLTRYGGIWRLILTGVAIGFLLYVLTKIVSDFGEHGIIDPVLAAWLPPIVALTFGATALLHQEDG